MDKSTFLLIQFLPNSQCSKSFSNVKRQARSPWRKVIYTFNDFSRYQTKTCKTLLKRTLHNNLTVHFQ